MALHTQAPGRRFDGQILDLSDRFAIADTVQNLTERDEAPLMPDPARGRGQTVLLLTESWPLGGVTEESFVRPEVEALARHFEHVVVIPTVDRGPAAELPAGVKLSRCVADSSLVHNPLRRCLLWLESPAHIGSTYWAWAKAVSKVLMRYMRRHSLTDRDTVAEAFWFDFQATALMMVHRHTGLQYMSRAHRYDIYMTKAPRLRLRTLLSGNGVRAVSQAGAEYLRHKFAPAAKLIGVAPLGVDTTGLCLTRRHTRADHAVTWLTVARAVPDKRPHLMLEALRALANTRRDLSIRWIYVGDGPEMPMLREAVANLPSNLTVELRGALPNSEVLALYATETIDFVLLLSRSEGLPITLLEGMACGVIPVATDVGGVSEAVDDSCGVLMPEDMHPDEFAGGVIPYIDSDSRAAAMSAAARQRVLRFYDATPLRDDFADDLSLLLT